MVFRLFMVCVHLYTSIYYCHQGDYLIVLAYLFVCPSVCYLDNFEFYGWIFLILLGGERNGPRNCN